MTPLVAIAPGTETFDPFAPFAAETAIPADDGSLIYRRCHWCHSAAAATCMLCPVCGSADLLPARSEGTGTVQRLLRPTRRGLHPGRPYLVALDEGFTVQASVVGGLPGAIPIGARVELAAADEEGRLLTFRLCPRT
ncbi:zinc ribbon domain-containing protein [Kitasatospora paracochleata]|uniref:DUF35 domain-containing protein n=1 Tax=Kitasatospora paracochleata TaxID=58354 RepID=A0ABT1IX38_9ACTN|nr:OB-fold domain-containing protein [Kitasatospora paracochleata]MCP2309101.1 hypothetical protein [Kitasatospora paracochleata]